MDPPSLSAYQATIIYLYRWRREVIAILVLFIAWVIT